MICSRQHARIAEWLDPKKQDPTKIQVKFYRTYVQSIIVGTKT